MNETAAKSNKENGKKEMMLQGIIEIGEIAYNEEQGRKKLLIEQSTSMIIALSLLIAFLGIILPVALNAVAHKGLVFIAFLCSALLLLASLVCVLLVQWRVKYKGAINAVDFFEEVRNNHEKYLEQSDFYEVKIGTLGEMTKTMNKNNNRRVKLIKTSHILVFVCIFVIIKFSLIIALLEKL